MISSNLFIKLRLLPLWKLFSKLEIFCCLLLTVKGGLKMSFYGEIKLYDYGGLILR